MGLRWLRLALCALSLSRAERSWDIARAWSMEPDEKQGDKAEVKKAEETDGKGEGSKEDAEEEKDEENDGKGEGSDEDQEEKKGEENEGKEEGAQPRGSIAYKALHARTEDFLKASRGYQAEVKGKLMDATDVYLQQKDRYESFAHKLDEGERQQHKLIDKMRSSLRKHHMKKMDAFQDVLDADNDWEAGAADKEEEAEEREEDEDAEEEEEEEDGEDSDKEEEGKEHPEKEEHEKGKEDAKDHPEHEKKEEHEESKEEEAKDHPEHEKQEVFKDDMEKLEKRLSVENFMDLSDAQGPKVVYPTEDMEDENDKKNPPKKVVTEGYAKIEWLIRGEFAEPLELNHFPFDTQELTLVIKVGLPVRATEPLHNFQDKDGASKVNLNIWPLYQAWTEPTAIDFTRSLSRPNYNTYQDRFPLFKATVKVTRNPKYHIYSVAVPLFFLVLMSWCSFAIAPEKKAERLSASLTLVLTAVVYKCEVPNISYHTLLDNYICMCWFFLFCMVLENCFAEQLHYYVLENELDIFFIFLALFLFFNLSFWCYGIYIYHKHEPLKSRV